MVNPLSPLSEVCTKNEVVLTTTKIQVISKLFIICKYWNSKMLISSTNKSSQNYPFEIELVMKFKRSQTYKNIFAKFITEGLGGFCIWATLTYAHTHVAGLPTIGPLAYIGNWRAMPQRDSITMHCDLCTIPMHCDIFFSQTWRKCISISISSVTVAQFWRKYAEEMGSTSQLLRVNDCIGWTIKACFQYAKCKHAATCSSHMWYA